MNILTRIPSPADSTSFYRAIGPFQHLRKIMDITLLDPSTYNWLNIGMADVVFLQRPHTDQDLTLVRLCKSLNRPVVVDYDDNLLTVPEWNPAYSTYQKSRDNIIEILRLADRVIVSTQHLARRLNVYRGVVCDVVRNAFPSHLVDFYYKHAPRQNIITWRGSNTHRKDVKLMYQAVSEAFELRDDWHLVMFGEPPYEAKELFGNKATVIEWQDTIMYLNALKAVAPAIHLVPLHDDEFNRAKSNIAYIEATYAGAVTISPDWDEWQPSSFKYGGPAIDM